MLRFHLHDFNYICDFRAVIFHMLLQDFYSSAPVKVCCDNDPSDWAESEGSSKKEFSQNFLKSPI